MHDLEYTMKQINNLKHPISIINRDLEASFNAIRQINQSTFSYCTEIGRCIQEMTSNIPNISIGINNDLSTIFSELNKNFYLNIDEINKILQPIFENQRKVFDSIFFEIDHSLQQNLQELLSQINIDEVLKNKEIIKVIKNSEIEITDNDLQSINWQAEFIYELMPDSKDLIESYKEKKYPKFWAKIIRYLFNIFFLCITLSQFIQYDTTVYKINRDNVRIRTSPSTDDNKNIICKLNKNISVIKIDSEDGWVKVRFEQEEGVQKEGWIYQTMLTKIE